MLAIRRTKFQNQRLKLLGIEPLAFEDLKEKLPQQPERLEFHLLFLVTSGKGRHCIDFVEYPINAQNLLLIHPGQVQQWQDYAGLQGYVVLIDPTSIPHAQVLASKVTDNLLLTEWPNIMPLPEREYRNLLTSLLRLQADFDDFDGSEMDIDLIRHELVGLLLRLQRWQMQQAGEQGEKATNQTYRLFRRMLEQEYKSQHQLNFYAQRLGYATSTLSRACIRAEGLSAKVVIDQRLLLEAKRMLVHSQASIAEVAYYLGFSETTNFIKFFRRLEGTTPQNFRQTQA